MTQLVVGRDLPNLKICVDNAGCNESVSLQSNEMDVEEKKDTTEENAELPVQVNINWDSVGISPHQTKRYENKLAFFVTEMKMTAEELQKKLEERAERFGDQLKPRRQVSQDEINSVYKSINLDVENLKSSSESQGIRLEALHIHGVTEMSTNDIFEYFKDYTPAWIEWVNDVSCNVVWFDEAGAVKALVRLSRPIALKKSREKDENGSAEIGNNKLDHQEDIIYVSEDELSGLEFPQTDGSATKAAETAEKTEDVSMEDAKPDDVEKQETETAPSEVSLPPGHWRLGMTHPKAKCLLLRFASVSDKKIPGAEKHSDYYKKYGNPNYGGLTGLISKTRKRRFRYAKEQKELKKILESQKATSDTTTTDADAENKSVTTDDEDTKIDKPDVPKRPRMRMHADDEENNQRRKNGVHDRLGKRIESASASETESESDEDDSSIEQDVYTQSSVWDRLEGASVARPSYRRTGFSGRQDLRQQLQDSSRSSSRSSSGGDLRSKLQRLRKDKAESPEHRSPMLTKPYQESK